MVISKIKNPCYNKVNMPIKFISLNDNFNKIIKTQGYEAINMRIEDYKCNKKTYYVSPANSLGYMNGGIDHALDRCVFPKIESTVKEAIKSLNIKNISGKYYLPIGSSMIIDDVNTNNSLIVAPTMLAPQPVLNTKNAYYATMAILYNIVINRNQDINDVDILFTSLCCGYGKMDINESALQILNGIKDFKNYEAIVYNNNVILCEPNLHEQPKYYDNSEWFYIEPTEVIRY